VSYDAPLFIQAPLTFAEIANLVRGVALPDFESELRYGLNVGGGDYYRFRRGREEIFLVCNDLAHGEAFRPERSECPFYCYAGGLNDKYFTQAQVALQDAGLDCRILPTD
jgi:hypothetical protein